jgi:anion-transporting  ArsA/GET3 family ATPase
MQSPDTSVVLKPKVLFLTGKGGTGKTALAAAIARLHAAQGKKTLAIEVDNQRPSLTAIFGVAPVYTPQEVYKNLFICNLEWTAAMDDWLADIVSIPRVVRMITHNRVVSVFLTATPGARDLVVLWRIYQLAKAASGQGFDQIVVDLPASGNAVAMMSVPNTAKKLFDAGPIRKCAEELLDFFRRMDVAFVQVALPEEMVVTETIETYHKIRSELPMLRIPAVILNRGTSPSLEVREVELLAKLSALPVSGLAAEAVGAGLWEAELEQGTASAQGRLQQVLKSCTILTLPFLPRGEGAGKVVSQLAGALARGSHSPLSWRETG